MGDNGWDSNPNLRCLVLTLTGKKQETAYNLKDLVVLLPFTLYVLHYHIETWKYKSLAESICSSTNHRNNKYVEVCPHTMYTILFHSIPSIVQPRVVVLVAVFIRVINNFVIIWTVTMIIITPMLLYVIYSHPIIKFFPPGWGKGQPSPLQQFLPPPPPIVTFLLSPFYDGGFSLFSVC